MSKAIEEMKRETRIETVIQIGKYKQLTPEQIAQDLVSICELTEEAAWKEMEERCEKSERIAKELMKKHAPVIMSRHSAIERDTHECDNR